MTMTVQPRTVSDQDFRDIVDADIRGTVNADNAALIRSPEHIDRWIRTLLTIKTSVEGQLGARRSDLNRKVAEKMIDVRDARDAGDERARRRLLNEIESERADYERWRASVLRFKSGVESKIYEATMLHHDPRDEVVKEERNEALFALRAMSNAVKEHYDLVSAEYDPTDADRDLWRRTLGVDR